MAYPQPVTSTGIAITAGHIALVGRFLSSSKAETKVAFMAPELGKAEQILSERLMELVPLGFLADQRKTSNY